MSRSLNLVVLIGHVGRRPELRTTASGARVATFSVATNRGPRATRVAWGRDRPPSGGEREATDWHRIVAWDGLAEWAGRWLDRGARVFVEGRVEYGSWSDRSGRRRDITEIVAADLIVFDSRAGGGEDAGQWRGRVDS